MALWHSCRLLDSANVIRLTLLHPLQSIPVRSWVFDKDNVIRIGRSLKNDVVLYSAVVSRHHVEICHVGQYWLVVNLGTNGTYIDGQAVQQIRLVDGQVIRLAISGPKILLNILPDPTESVVTGGTDQQQSTETLYSGEVTSYLSPQKPLFPHPNDEITEVDQRQQFQLPTNH